MSGRQCTAKSKRTGERCQRPPLRLTGDKCYHHSGLKRSDREAAQARNDFNQQAQTLLSRMGRPEAIADPLTELLHLATEAKRWKDVVGQLVGELTAVGYRAGSGEQTKAEVAVYTTALRDLGKLLTDIARLGIEERLVRIEEDRARRMQSVLMIAARRLGLDLQESRVIEAVQSAIVATEPKQIGGVGGG